MIVYRDIVGSAVNKTPLCLWVLGGHKIEMLDLWCGDFHPPTDVGDQNASCLGHSGSRSTYHHFGDPVVVFDFYTAAFIR